MDIFTTATDLFHFMFLLLLCIFIQLFFIFYCCYSMKRNVQKIVGVLRRLLIDTEDITVAIDKMAEGE